MISGGSNDGDSNRARKSRSRRYCMEVEGVRRSEAVISFGPEDLKGVSLPHNDALVIQARVANYDIMRVFVDSGSSVNVNFKEALVQMDLQGYQLESVETTLFGFAGHAVYPEGEIIFPLTLGCRIHVPPEDKISSRKSSGRGSGDQNSSRKCYVETVRVDRKRVRREDKGKSHNDVERIVEKREVHFVAEQEQERMEIEPGKEIRVARDLDSTTRVNLLNCLKTNIDVFAWSQQELTGISPQMAEHSLNIIPGSHPVKQKKRHFGPEKDTIIDMQVRELLKADHIREYHQITLTKVDQDKASFITLGGTFCCVVMSFGLKNAGATYQRLMNIVFEMQLGRNVEVYVDDILGKSREISSFIIVLEDNFATLTHYGIKLNPAKCIFSVKSGKFLGFGLTDWGIEVNPKKVKAVLDMPSSRSVREPEPGENLFVYLSTTEYAVSSVLIREEGIDQRPVYYVSHALRGPELRLLERIMTHSEVSRRMIKWTVELVEYDIEYKPQVAIKAHALSDFSSEMVQPNMEEVWRVFVDRASSLPGFGIGVVIIAPPGEKIKLALRIDSRIKGVYEAKDDMMLKYLKLIKAHAESFVDWSIEQIPRDENGEADALAKMTATLSEVKTREVLHVTRLILSMDEKMLPVPEDSWMTLLIKFIVHNELPEDRAQAQKIKRQAPRFVLLNNILYRRSYQGPLLKILYLGDVDYVLREIHERCYGEHLGGIASAQKAILAGFLWPNISQDSARVVRACVGCQHHYNFQHNPATLMKPPFGHLVILINGAWILWEP
ncbi:uncharacterized protein [Primulina huaijiensis]|uniref:uncharacterized protein n=1 Tax=Primulina huaijiensis TaxID=1492673 RepID=UPI003CC74B94